MASSVNRRIEGHLSRVMGQRDPAGLIRPRSTEPIRACGLAPRLQAVHMTAIGLRCRHVKKSLRAGGHPHMTRWPSAHGLDPWAFTPFCNACKTWMPGARPGTTTLDCVAHRRDFIFVALKTFPGQPCAVAGKTHNLLTLRDSTWVSL